jgi:UDP-3-O-[3-hydroxymyristoyl] glucosamine N-acyltransferase
MMGWTVERLAAAVRAEVRGDAAAVITAARPLGDAGAGHVTFVEGEKQVRLLAGCAATALVVPAALADRLPVTPPALLVVPDALLAFVALVELLHGKPAASPPGIDSRAAVHPGAVLGPDARVEAFASVGEGTVVGARCVLAAGARVGRRCRLGDDVVLHPNVVLYDGTILGHRVEVHANAVIGSDGFGYRFDQGRHRKVPQLGWVEVGDDVEIGAGTTIDRGTFQATKIGAGTKIDNLVQIGHNCVIGPHNMLAGQVGIAGSSTTGAYVVMAGQVGVADHLHVGDGAVLGARCGLAGDVPAGGRWLGTPGRPEREAKRALLSLDRLPAVIREVRRLLDHLGLEPGPQRGDAGAA